MRSLIKAYSDNRGKHSLFSEIIYIDYYDGATQAVCKIDKTEQWVICALTYFNIKEQQRIFAIIESSAQWVLNLKSALEKNKGEGRYENIKKEISSAFSGYSDDAYLMKAEKLESMIYEVVEVPLTSLKYFNNIEDVLDQDEKSSLQWTGFFKT